MIKVKILSIFLFIKTLITPCHIPEENHPVKKHPKFSVRKAGKMPELVNEGSALLLKDGICTWTARYNFTDSVSSSCCSQHIPYSFWTLNDHGGKSELYEVYYDNLSGKFGKSGLTWKINNASNYDWEELADDDKGNIYIGDFGNNYNIRKNLRIFKVNRKDSLKTDTICFSFSDQKEFPPSKDQMNFDCEAFFWYEDSLYLFSKNRGKGPVKVYRLPDKPGVFTAELFKEINISGMITSADISKDKKTMVLLSYGRIYFFNLSETGTLNVTSSFCKKFPRSAQSEGICFVDANTLAVSNEQGHLYLLKKKLKKHQDHSKNRAQF